MHTIFLGLLILFLSVFNSSASAVENDIELLLSTKKWSKASKYLFIEAAKTSKSGVSIVVGDQAKAGYIMDSYDLIESSKDHEKVYAILQVVNKSLTLDVSEKKVLLEKALKHLKSSKYSQPDTVAVRELAQISITYHKLGMQREAKSVFKEVLSVARKSEKESRKTGIDGITGDFIYPTIEEMPEWMEKEILGILNIENDLNVKSRVYLHLSKISYRHGNKDNALKFIKHGLLLSENIKNKGEKNRSIRNLLSFAISIGESGLSDKYNIRDKLIYDQSIYMASIGEVGKSYELVGQLGRNLYVDKAYAAYEVIIKQALERNDLKTATYFADRPIREYTLSNINLLTAVANSYLAINNSNEAHKYYDKAVLIANTYHSKQYSRYYFKEIIFLANSVINVNRETGLSLLQMAHEKLQFARKSEIAYSMIYVAESIWRVDLELASSLLVSAYKKIKSAQGVKDFKRTRMLNALANTAFSLSKLSIKNVHFQSKADITFEHQERPLMANCGHQDSTKLD